MIANRLDNPIEYPNEFSGEVRDHLRANVIVHGNLARRRSQSLTGRHCHLDVRHIRVEIEDEWVAEICIGRKVSQEIRPSCIRQPVSCLQEIADLLLQSLLMTLLCVLLRNLFAFRFV